MNESKPALRTLGKYVSEILVIIVGITLSFAFDEWRRDREDQRAERGYLIALRADLAQDTAMLAFNISGGTWVLRATERLINFRHADDIADSLHILIDAAASYAAFSPATATYEELRQTGRTDLLRDDTLRHELLRLHNAVYAAEREISAVDKAHVLNQLIPALSEHFPLTADSALMAPAQRHIASLQVPAVRNRLITGIAFKRGLLQMHNVSKAVCTALLARVERRLAQ